MFTDAEADLIETVPAITAEATVGLLADLTLAQPSLTELLSESAVDATEAV